MEATAYAVFAEGSDVGKKVKGSKKRFVWEIIFKEDADQAQASKHTCVVELKHSVLAGRRTIAFNGEVIHDSAKVLNGKFEHGWAHKRHLLRITAKADIVKLIAEKQEYELWVDNVRFSDLPSYDEYVVEQEKKRSTKTPSKAHYRKQLLRLVQQYDPKNVAKVDQVLAKWAGREEQLIAGLKTKYAKQGARAPSPSPAPAPAPAPVRAPAPAADPWGSPAPAASDPWGSPAPAQQAWAPAPAPVQNTGYNTALFSPSPAPAPTGFNQQRSQNDAADDLFSPAPATQQQKADSFQDELSLLYAPAPAPAADPFAATDSYGGGMGQQTQAYPSQPRHHGQQQTAPPKNSMWAANSNLFDLNNLGS